MSAVVDERIIEEVDALEAIMMDDVIIKRDDGIPKAIETVIHPSTGNNVTQQYVRVTLEIKLTPGYPDCSPDVLLSNPRGLDDEVLNNINAQIKQKLGDWIGQPVAFELIALVRESLTESNLPRGQCAICLFGFTEGDIFLKTPCYHYYHTCCFATHLISAEEYYTEEIEKLPSWKRMQARPYQQSCPVCRCPVTFDVDSLKEAPPSAQSLKASPFHPTPELKAMQKKMAELLAKQIANGGIVSDGDTGPPPLTITSPSDKENEAQGTSGSDRAAPKTDTTAAQANETNSGDVDAPASPRAKNDYRGPYRGFNRRGKPGRRGRGAR